jgi:ammonia channel protein AmtB
LTGFTGQTIFVEPVNVVYGAIKLSIVLIIVLSTLLGRVGVL